MRRLLLQMQMSVDGFMAAHHPVQGWTLWDWGPECPWDGELVKRFNDTLADVALKRASGQDIICFGGVAMASAVLETGLVDTLELYVNPRAVARGDSIFDRPRSLELLEATPYPCGISVQRYRPLP